MAKLQSSVPAIEDARCLACHTNPALAEPGRTTDARVLELRREGVSCEACHGNAGGWLREHTAWDGRIGGSPFGMTPLNDIGDRATACVGCHVGAPADKDRGYPVRDLNHDMIAAGHPRLNFDFGEFHRRLPKHWHDFGRGRAFEARLWIVGRVAHAEAACALLADRAERATQNDPRTPWPEFAEFDCAACHHAIPLEWRNRPERLGTRRPGTLAWQSIWPVAESIRLDGGRESIRPVLATMQGNRAPGSNAIQRPAKDAAERLGRLRRRLADSPDEALRLAVECFPPAVPDRPDWDSAGQMLQGLAAMERAQLHSRSSDTEFDQAFEAVMRRNWGEAKPAIDRLLALPRTGR
jgi:hypothetical protein